MPRSAAVASDYEVTRAPRAATSVVLRRGRDHLWPATRLASMAATPEKTGFRERLRQLGMAFQFTRRHDKALIPLVGGVFLGVLAVGVLLIFLVSGVTKILVGVVFLLLALLAALALFSRRVAKATFAEVEGMPGAAAAVMQNLRGPWHVTPAVAFTVQQDLIHRVVGRPGVVLVCEGSPQRLKNMLTQEKKRVSRVLPEVPIVDLSVGDGEGQVPISKLQTRLMKLPRHLSGSQISAVNQRLAALGGAKPPIPKGPMMPNMKSLRGAKQQMYRGR
jgi:hypothetical protein